MTDDAELLRSYAADRSEPAFAELVGRHVDLVYSAALRQMGGDHHRAQEVTQMVFIDLARKAAALHRHPVLAAWLHRSTYYGAAALRRREGRRQKYERAAVSEAVASADEGEAIAWEGVRPVLDDALNELCERDREAILLRFFSNRPFAEVGRQMSMTENAARMRVERALGKLHALLARRGITSSSAALAAMLAGHGVAAAPLGVATATTGGALAVAGAAPVAWIALMTTSKLPLLLSAAALLGGGALFVAQRSAGQQRAQELADLSRQNQEIPALREQNKALAAAAEQARNLRMSDSSLSVLQAQVAKLQAKANAQSSRASGALPKNHVRSLNIDAGSSAYDYKLLDQAPAPIFQKRPDYAPALMKAGVSGEVLVDFVVGADGLVYNAHAVSSSQPEFEDSAVQAVSQWTFTPGQLKGQSVNTHMQVPIVYTLTEPPRPTAATWF
jgi:RNA polymerase sigma factor (sigma-70 family)